MSDIDSPRLSRDTDAGEIARKRQALEQELEANRFARDWRSRSVQAAVTEATERLQDEQATRAMKAALLMLAIRWGAILTLTLMFLLIVWPGVYRYEHSSFYLIRVNRVTGSAAILNQGAWQPVQELR